MRGKVRFAKFPKGLYYCQIEDVKAGLTSGNKDIIVVFWRVQEGPKKGELIKERMNSVSSNFLKGIGEPYEYNSEWDTQNWRGKFCWVDVKYSEDEQQWQRYGHHVTNPLEIGPTAKGDKPKDDLAEEVSTGVADDDIPF